MNKGLLMLGMATLLSVNVTANANATAIEDAEDTIVAANDNVVAAAVDIADESFEVADYPVTCELSKMFPVPAIAAHYVNVSTANTTVALDDEGKMDSISELVQGKAMKVGGVAKACVAAQ